MGLNFIGVSRSSCVCGTNVPGGTPIEASPVNPDPNNYQIIDKYEYKCPKGTTYVALLIKYTGCTNFEGQKILVYQNCTLVDLLLQRELDPHFCDNQNHIYPIARFIPTFEGWEMAKQFIQTCTIFHPYSIDRFVAKPEKIKGSQFSPSL